MNGFGALHQTAQGQRFRSGQFGDRSQPRIVQLAPSAAHMPADQAHDATLFPGVAPVVDRLMADAALLSNRRRMLPFAQHQQPRCAQAGIPPGMIDRELKQRFAFAGTQCQAKFHWALLFVYVITHESKFQSSYDELLKQFLKLILLNY